MDRRQIEFKSLAPEDDIASISALIPAQSGIVRIDGHSGVGKSRLSKALAPYRNWQLIQLDKFIVGDRPGRKFVFKLDREKVHDALLRSLAVGATIVDGLCLEHLTPDSVYERGYRIYVKSDQYGELQSDEVDRRQQLGTGLYHKRYDPESTADFILTVPHAVTVF